MTDEINNPVVVTYDAENDWVFAVVRGATAIGTTLDMFRQARALAVERGTLKILIDMREMQSKTSFIDSYIFAKNFREKTGIDNSYRLAVVYNSANYPADRADTLQMVGENWGNIAGKMFTGMEAAIRFLRGE